MAETPLPAERVDHTPAERLDSWKEIAAYLRRNVTTVRRWEKRERLPVYRHLHDRQSSVYAYRAEIDAWWHARSHRCGQGKRPTHEGRLAWLTAAAKKHPGRVAMFFVFATAVSVLAAYGYVHWPADPATSRVDDAGAVPPEGREQRARSARSLDASRYYLLGRQRLDKRTREGMVQAIADFQEALRNDPQYAAAYVGLADAHNLMGYYRFRPTKDAYGDARLAIMRALELDDDLAEAHTSRAHLFVREWNWAEAERAYKRAIALNPGYATARHWYANYLALMGRHEESIVQATRAAELEPLSLSVNAGALANAYLQAGYLDRAIEQLRKALELDPRSGGIHHALGIAYARQGRYAEALAAMQVAGTLRESGTWRANMGSVYAAMGRGADALNILEELDVRRSDVSPVALAALAVAVGQRDRAFTVLEDGYRERDPDLASLNIEPGLKPIRQDPRFQDLRRRVGLPPS